MLNHSTSASTGFHLRHMCLGTAALWTDTFIKAQNAVNYFMSNKKLTVIKTVKEEAYPLPKAKRAKK